MRIDSFWVERDFLFSRFVALSLTMYLEATPIILQGYYIRMTRYAVLATKDRLQGPDTRWAARAKGCRRICAAHSAKLLQCS